jgi:2-polyprenyl-6-methoxyphenol hydroxylase-like FAD-dependent oxidoreductase
MRRLLHPDEGPPRPSGLYALRGVAYGVAEHLEGFSGGQYFGRGIEAGVAQASRDAVYWYLSMPEALIGDVAAGARAVRDRAMQAFPAALRSIMAATGDEDMRLDRLVDRAPLESWGRGVATLLGDAAHPMLPHAGQGAAQALEDAVALGRIVPAAGDSVPAGLQRYERLRAPRTRAIVELARRNARLGSIAHPLLCRLRDEAIHLMPKAVLLKSLIAVGRPPVPE